MINIENEQKDILLMTAFFKAGGDLQIYYVVGLSLIFDLFQPVSPALYPSSSIDLAVASWPLIIADIRVV